MSLNVAVASLSIRLAMRDVEQYHTTARLLQTKESYVGEQRARGVCRNCLRPEVAGKARGRRVGRSVKRKAAVNAAGHSRRPAPPTDSQRHQRRRYVVAANAR
jgi:hypothetical protein